jgi:hypothetical protein
LNTWLSLVAEVAGEYKVRVMLVVVVEVLVGLELAQVFQ